MIKYIFLFNFNIFQSIINLKNMFLNMILPIHPRDLLSLSVQPISHFSQSLNQSRNFKIFFQFSPWYLWLYLLFQPINIFILIYSSLSILNYLINFILDNSSDIITINIFLMTWNRIAYFLHRILNFLPSSYFLFFWFLLGGQSYTK